MNKKAQGWGVDLIAAAVIFSLGVVVFYVYSINLTDDSSEIFESLNYEGELIFESLLSEGSPENWTQDTVASIGLINDAEIDSEKLSSFYNLTQENYSFTKSLFNIQYDYYVVFNRNLTIDSVEISRAGKPGTDLETLAPENLAKISRFSTYQNKPVTIDLYIWKN